MPIHSLVNENAPVLAGYHYIPLLVEDHDHRYHGCERSGVARGTFKRQRQARGLTWWQFEHEMKSNALLGHDVRKKLTPKMLNAFDFSGWKICRARRAKQGKEKGHRWPIVIYLY